MGWSDIGPYGSEIPTPNLDALAARGARFTQFYSTPRCSPTRASLLTGVYPHQAGMGHLEDVVRRGSTGTTGRLNNRSVTIAEVLRETGYFTAMAGKWHLGQDNGSPPWQRGFDRVLSLRQGGMFFPNQNYQGGGDTLTRRAREPLYVDGTPMPRDSAMFGENWYATYLWTDFGLKFIDEARKASKPFFLYLPHNAPHFPLMAPAELIARHRGRYKAGWDRLRDGAIPPPDQDGPDRRQVAVEPARSGVAGLGIALRRREGSLRPSDGRLCGDGRGDRREHRHAGQGLAGPRRPRQHDDPVSVGQRRQCGIRSGRAFRRRSPWWTELEPVSGHELGDAQQYSVPPVQAFHA